MMKTIKQTNFSRLTSFLIVLGLLGGIVGCEEDLPGANSKEDTIPPEAGFSYSSDIDDFRTIRFTNLSTEATDFLWNFGGDNTSTEEHPTFVFEAGEGTYSVSLTASDKLGATNTYTQDVLVEEGPFQPVILEAGFEDNELPDGTGDGRDSWRNNDLGGVIQITSSPVVNGSQGAKLTGSVSDQRIGYQELMVEPDANYDVNFFYTLLSTPSGYLTVDILDVSDGTITSHEQAQGLVLGSVTVNNQEDPDAFVSATVSFNSGTSDKIAIYFYNGGSVEARLDDFSIDIGSGGAIPPSVGFTAKQSETNYLEYSFTNSSINADSYLWDFGDGNTSTEQNPTYTYAAADVYTVTLTASSDGGLSSELSTVIDIQAPVTAAFSYEIDASDYQTYSFTSISEDAVSLMWDFGDGFQSTLESPMHTYAADGEYMVTLTATSITGATDIATENIVVAQGFVPIILEGGFEDGQLDGGTGDGRDSWRVSGGDRPDGMGGVIQITSSPVKSGGQAAKFPSDNTRAAYQEVQVEAGKNYTVDFWYTLKDSPSGSLTVAILDQPVSDPANIAGATIASTTVTDQTDPETYVNSSVSFNSGTSETIVIYITNTDVEARIDDISIVEN